MAIAAVAEDEEDDDEDENEDKDWDVEGGDRTEGRKWKIGVNIAVFTYAASNYYLVWYQETLIYISGQGNLNIDGGVAQ